MQPSLIQTTQLFDPALRKQYLDEKRMDQIPNEATRAKKVLEWVQWLDSQHDSQITETSLEQSFNTSVLVGSLGYELWPGSDATAWPKPPSSATGTHGIPDVGLGLFSDSDSDPFFMAILELKTPGTDLDKPQARSDRKSPVEQGFSYAANILGVKWVLVSDMRLIRLYSVENPSGFEEFDLRKCVDPSGSPTQEFRRLYFFLNPEFLIGDGTDSGGLRLLAGSSARQLRIRDAFYRVYSDARNDVLEELRVASSQLTPMPSDEEIVVATQRLFDRLLFLYYCEDHPQQLVPAGTVKSVTESARNLPGVSNTRVYEALKALFREVDTSSPPSSGLKLPGYNGELFKHDPILDVVDLPDSLHDKRYTIDDDDVGVRVVQGTWGLHVFNFWQELNEHLLGHIFEESLSDIVASTGNVPSLGDRLSERKRHGIYYTDQILADYLASTALASWIAEEVGSPPEDDSDVGEWLDASIQGLGELKVIDTACGSGAFLVSAFRETLRELWRLQDLQTMMIDSGRQLDLTTVIQQLTQAQLLRTSLYGIDLLPQAVEIAKLALWLRSAKKGEKVTDLGHNIVTGDSLDIPAVYSQIEGGKDSFHLVLGNPPWGAEVDRQILKRACEYLGIDPNLPWDTWELFLLLGLDLLREGGRIALVLPDTIFSSEKARTREILLQSSRIEFLHNLGPGWFGPTVRMGTTVLVARKGTPPIASDFRALLLTGGNRKKAQKGELPISQLVNRFGLDIPQERSVVSPNSEIEIFRSRRDDQVMETIEQNSVTLADVCDRWRGEEMSKAGLLWICPSCQMETVPGRKRKGGGYSKKECPSCGFLLDQSGVRTLLLVRPSPTPGPSEVGFIDGDDIARRYHKIRANKMLRLDVAGFSYKDKDLYEAPKIMIRQAGVGITATLDDSGARSPQSVYLYRVRPEFAARGYSNRLVLAALSSRTMAYYIFKRFGEVDPDRAHAKLTHRRLESLPIPKAPEKDQKGKKLVETVVDGAEQLLSGSASLGGQEDLNVELALRKLWGLSGDDGAFINGQFQLVPSSQPIRDLFPEGIPSYTPTAG